jgi:uncharacterized protein (UPF0548 family)
MPKDDRGLRGPARAAPVLAGAPPAGLRELIQEQTVFQGPDAAGAFERCRAILFAFEFYDPGIVTARVSSQGVQVGERLEQRIRLGPLRFLGPVRVLDRWEQTSPEGREAGFAYEALPGHLEKGIASFSLRRQGSQVLFRIHSHSAAAAWFVRLGGPAARWMQRRVGRTAMRRMAQAAQGRLGLARS